MAAVPAPGPETATIERGRMSDVKAAAPAGALGSARSAVDGGMRRGRPRPAVCTKFANFRVFLLEWSGPL
jgi:hypothetical protein